jgi:hypothetical protein
MCEAEYIALLVLILEMLWIKKVINNIIYIADFTINIVYYGDNKLSINLVKNNCILEKSKYI